MESEDQEAEGVGEDERAEAVVGRVERRLIGSTGLSPLNSFRLRVMRLLPSAALPLLLIAVLEDATATRPLLSHHAIEGGHSGLWR